MIGVIWQKRVLALAGLLQAIQLVSSIARTGLVSQDTMDASLRSIFVQNPGSISEVFGGTRGVKTGLGLVREILKGFDRTQHGDLMRYSLAVVKLERSLAAKPALLRDLGARIASIDERRMLREQADSIDQDTVTALAELYQDTLSRISPRIKVSGERDYLQNATNADRIRALLLAAVRAAVLWHQVGGRRWHFILARGAMKEALYHIV